MENLRARLKFGNKEEAVKLRRRKSQLYSKEDKNPFNGALITEIYVNKTVIISLICAGVALTQ